MRKIFLAFLILTFIVIGGLAMSNEPQVAIAECHPPFAPCEEYGLQEEYGPQQAPPGYCPPGKLCNPLGANTFDELLVAITNFLLIISIPIVSIMVLYGGFQILTAAGTPDKIEKGKKTIIYSVVGFVVILLANSVAFIIRDILS